MPHFVFYIFDNSVIFDLFESTFIFQTVYVFSSCRHRRAFVFNNFLYNQIFSYNQYRAVCQLK